MARSRRMHAPQNFSRVYASVHNSSNRRATHPNHRFAIASSSDRSPWEANPWEQGQA